MVADLKKILLLWLLGSGLAMAQTCVPSSSVTCTPNISLSLPVLNSLNWNTPLNNNFSLIDSLLSGNAILPGLKVSGPVSFPGNLTATTGQNSFSLFSLDNIVYIDGNKYPATDAGLVAASTAAGANGTVVLPPNTTISVTGAHSFLSGQRLFCESPTSGFNMNIASGFPFTISGVNDVRISGCTFTWQSGITFVLDISNTVSRVMLDNNRFVNFPSSGTGTAVFIGDRSNTNCSTLLVSDVTVTDNTFTNNAGININILDCASRIIVERNRFTTGSNTSFTTAFPINAQTIDASTVITNLSIIDNTIYNNEAGDCVQVQQVGGSPIVAVTVAHNICTWLTASNGFSMAGINGLTQVGNVVNANGNNVSLGNAVFEFANIKNSTESGDAAFMGTQSGSSVACYTIIGGGSALVTSGNSFSNNQCQMSYTGASTSESWFIGATNPTETVKNNTMSGNTADLSGSTGKVAGVFVQTANASAAVTNNLISGNTFIGANVTGDCGICIEQDSGTLSGTTLNNNQALNFHLQNGSNYGGQFPGFVASTISPTALTTGNAVALTADWTCGTGGTVASCVAATIIGSTTQPMTFALPISLQSYTLQCDGVVGQATAATANQWNLLTATNGATNVTANYSMATAATASAYGAVTDQASTTTTFQIAPSWTLGGTATKMPFHIWARIEAPSLSGTTLSVQLVAPTVADLVTIYRGTTCTLY